MPNIYMVKSDEEPVFVLADDFPQAINLWRQCHNERCVEYQEVDLLTEEDQPDEVIKIADDDDVYIPGPSCMTAEEHAGQVAAGSDPPPLHLPAD